MRRATAEHGGSNSGSARRLPAARAVLGMPPMMAQHHNTQTVGRLLEKQMIRKRPEVGAAEVRSGDPVKTLGILLDGSGQASKFVLEAPSDSRPGLRFVIAQGISEVPRNQRMEAPSHCNATTASPPVSLPPGSSPSQGSDPVRHSCAWPRRLPHHRRRELPAASPASEKPVKPGHYRGVSSLPARFRSTFAYLNITPHCQGRKSFRADGASASDSRHKSARPASGTTGLTSHCSRSCRSLRVTDSRGRADFGGSR